MKINEFIKENDIKLSPKSKAYKLLQSKNCNEFELTRAIMTTKAYVTNQELQKMVYNVVFNDAKKCNEHVQNMDNVSNYDKGRCGEARGTKIDIVDIVYM